MQIQTKSFLLTWKLMKQYAAGKGNPVLVITEKNPDNGIFRRLVLNVALVSTRKWLKIRLANWKCSDFTKEEMLYQLTLHCVS